MNALAVLNVVSTLLASVGTITIQMNRIRDVIGRAQSEGRDVTDEELASIQAETDALQKSVLDRLKAAEG